MRRFTVLIMMLVFAISATVAVWGNTPLNQTTRKIKKPQTITSIDNDTRIDVNNLDMWVTNHGSFAWDLITGNAGLIFPKGTTKTAVFASGLWIGAKVRDTVRVTVAEYSQEYAPGPMQDSTFLPDIPRFRVYKINRGDTTSADYLNWPIQDGAPVDSLGRPAILGDQMLWAVYNDADPSFHSNDAGASPPLGIEVHQTTFAFDEPEPLGNVIFLKFKLINKGPNTLDSTYLSLWSDPDLGGFTDDLVGCDTLLSLGYCYNSTNNDDLYGSAPPAVGYDFFQGPIGDNNQRLPMTSFNKYINGTDPRSKIESYNYMKGLLPDGSDLINPITNQVTKFFMTGDPVQGTGWLDANPADRRFMLSAGPFTFTPGDTQEVVGAIIIGQGADRLSSITILKDYDRAAQTVFDLNFQIPSPPPRPRVFVQELDNAVQLTWDQLAVGDVQTSEPLNQEYHFEGYNIYQGASLAGPWTKIATFDLADSIQTLYRDVFDPLVGAVVRKVTQTGTDNGLTFGYLATEDKVLGGPLINAKEYYFAVTAYSYDVRNLVPYYVGSNLMGYVTNVKENSKAVIRVVPRSQGGVIADTAEHVAGTSEGVVYIEYLQPDSITSHNYMIIFDDTTSSEVMWSLIDVTTGDTLLKNQTNMSGDRSYPIVHGFMPRVKAPAMGVKLVGEVLTDGSLLNVFRRLSSDGNWYVTTAGGGLERFTWAGYIGNYDYEVRFTATGSEYYDFNTDARQSDRAPFEIWNIGVNTVTDPSDDVRLFIWDLDDDNSGGYTFGDRVYTFQSGTYSEPIPDPAVYNWPVDSRLGRIIIALNDTIPPATGAVIRFLTYKAPTSADVYTFRTYKPGTREGSVVTNDLSKVRAVPNPYYNRSQYELTQFDRVIKFTNVPFKCTIKIYNIAGDLVRTLTKDDPGEAILPWDVLTENRLPVASGVYIWRLEAPGIGSRIGKMVVFMEEEQLNNF